MKSVKRNIILRRKSKRMKKKSRSKRIIRRKNKLSKYKRGGSFAQVLRGFLQTGPLSTAPTQLEEPPKGVCLPAHPPTDAKTSKYLTESELNKYIQTDPYKCQEIKKREACAALGRPPDGPMTIKDPTEKYERIYYGACGWRDFPPHY